MFIVHIKKVILLYFVDNLQYVTVGSTDMGSISIVLYYGTNRFL